MTKFEVIESGLCCECQPEVYTLTYGKENITPKKYPDDYKKRQRAQTAAFNEMAEQRKTKVVVVATFFDDFGGGEIKALLCERHLRLALGALEGKS